MSALATNQAVGEDDLPGRAVFSGGVREIGAFDYSGLTHEKSVALKAAADRIRSLIQRTTTSIIETGNELLSAKIEIGHRNFGQWIEAEFSMSQRTAQNYMRAAIWAKGKIATVSLLPPSTIYLLSARSTPPAVTEEVIGRLERGERIDAGKVRETIKESREQARLSPRARRRRARDKDDRQKQQEGWIAERATQAEAAERFVEFLLDRLDDDDVAEFLDMVPQLRLGFSIAELVALIEERAQ